MIFLIEYDRTTGRLVQIREFADSNRRTAEDARLELELSLQRQSDEHEVVLLEAASSEALRLTHRRYFEDVESLSRLPGVAGTPDQ